MSENTSCQRCGCSCPNCTCEKGCERCEHVTPNGFVLEWRGQRSPPIRVDDEIIRN